MLLKLILESKKSYKICCLIMEHISRFSPFLKCIGHYQNRCNPFISNRPPLCTSIQDLEPYWTTLGGYCLSFYHLAWLEANCRCVSQFINFCNAIMQDEGTPISPNVYWKKLHFHHLISDTLVRTSLHGNNLNILEGQPRTHNGATWPEKTSNFLLASSSRCFIKLRWVDTFWGHFFHSVKGLSMGLAPA